MDDIVYSTDSDEHLIAIGVKYEPQWDYFNEQDLKQELYDSWDWD